MVNDNIINFLADLGALVPKDFNTSPEISDYEPFTSLLKDFADDTIVNNIVSTHSKSKPYDLVSSSDPGDPIPCTQAPFPKRNTETTIAIVEA